MTNIDDVGKLFVGGLSWETTKEALQNYFGRFGEVVDCVVMKNNETGRSRGFGFVTFKDPGCVTAVLQMKPHELNGRTIDAKECTPRSMQKNKKGVSQGKVFLGGLPPDVTETDIRNALARYGKVNHVTIMCDQETKKCRGFGFLSFESEDSIEQACAQRFVNINGKQIECKRAEPRDRRSPGQPYGMGNENGAPRPGAYGSTGGFQASWNQPPQQYTMQGQAYGTNYQSYNAAPYPPNAMPYNSVTHAAAPYAQPTYPGYGAMGYGYQTPAPVPAPNANYSQQAPNAYTQPPAAQPPAYNQAAAPSDLKTPNAFSGPYAQNYIQNAPAYGPSKTYGSQAVPNGAGYTNQTTGAGRGQGYHPYRR